MEREEWVGAYKIRTFSWIDGKRLYFNVQYYLPGKSVEQPPAWDKTVYITDNVAGRNVICNFIDSLVNYVSKLKIEDGRVIVLTF